MQNLEQKMKKNGENIRRLRLERGLSVNKLSALTSISRKYIQKLEDGQAKYITLKHLDRLCYVFDLSSLNELITF